MRKFIATIALALASMTAAAQTGTSSESEEYCKVISDVASLIMKMRQDGVPMSRLVDRFSKIQDSMSGLTKLMVVSAYEEPRFTSSEYRQRAIIDFENRNYLACIKVEMRSSRQ